MKQLEFSIVTYIEATMKELDITTTVLIDTDSEVTFLATSYYLNSLIKELNLNKFILHLLT